MIYQSLFLACVLLGAHAISVEQQLGAPTRPVEDLPRGTHITLQKAQSPRAGNAVACETCVDFFDEFLGILIKALLQIGVVGSCGELCSFIPEKYAQAFCTIVCLGVGLDEFVHLLNTADLDPVYLCTETDACPKNSCTGAHCTSITKTWVTPAKAKLRSTFTFHAQVKASAATGSGLTVFGIRCPNCNKQGVIEMAALNEGFAAGSTHVINATLDTAEDDWQYPIGTVQFEALSCLYGCQDKYGKIWSKAYGSFEIEQN